MKKTLILSICMLTALTLGFGQTLLYYWNFNTGIPATDQSWAQPIPANQGNADLTYTFTEGYSFGGTLINGIDGEVVGGCFAPRGGLNNVNNGAYFTMMVSTIGFGNITISYPTNRTSTGFTTQEIKYTLDGTNWVTKETISLTAFENNWVATQVVNVDFSSIPGSANNANFGIRVVCNGGSSATGNNRIDNIRISGSLPGSVVVPVFNPPGGFYMHPVNVVVTTTTSGASIRYTTNGADPTESSTLYSTPIPVTSTTTINAKAFATGLLASETASVTYSYATTVNNLSDLRQMPVDNTVYYLPNPVILTYKQTSGNKKYVQDTGAGILIYDAAGIITTNYNIGDAIPGLTGRLLLYFDTLQFVPISNTAPATSTGNVIPTPTVTIAQLNADVGVGVYQSRMVRINQVHFNTPTGYYNANPAVNYGITDETGSMTFRTSFPESNYIGTPMHTGIFNLQGIIAHSSIIDPAQITPRFITDFNAPFTPIDPLGMPTLLPSSMTVMARVNIDAVSASTGDVLAAYVYVNGIPQLRGKQTIQLISGLAGAIIQVYTETNGETISFKVWDASTNEIIPSVTTLASVVCGYVGSLQNPFMIYTSAYLTQTIALASGCNLVSFNVSPANHTISSLIASIAADVQQIKGTEGVYIPNNPFSTLSFLTDGKAYNILTNNATSWSVTGIPIPATTPLAMLDGWNMVAYLPQTALPVVTAVQSISNWLLQVKGTDGVYIPNNPYSTLTTMYPNKGYWIKQSGEYDLVYPGSGKSVESFSENNLDIPVTILPSSMTVLAKCEAAGIGDILLARVNGEIRGAETFVSPEGFAAVLIQIYTETTGEEVSFSILKPDNTELPLATTLSSQPQAVIGTYPNFLILEPKAAGEDSLPTPTSLIGCYPNPFNPSTTISFSVAQDNSPVTMEIYNIKGQKLYSLLNTKLSKGNHSIIWNGKDNNNHSVASGIYFIKMSTDGYNKTIKALLSK